MSRFDDLKNAYNVLLLHTRVGQQDWRPGMTDLAVYDILLGMHENDYEDVEPQFIWCKSPDEIMEHIINSGHIFDLEYGWDQLDEEIRDYLINEDFILDPDELSDEEYESNLTNAPDIK